MEKLDYRLEWDKHFLKYAKLLNNKKSVIITGDFNVTATTDGFFKIFNKIFILDFYFKNKQIRFPSCTIEERNSFKTIINDLNLQDMYSKFNKGKTTPSYTFWSYQGFNRKKNLGMRLDYFLASTNAFDCNYFPYINGSDHCPIILAL